MRAVQMTLDEELLAVLDQTVSRLGTTRSAFTREALQAALARLTERDLEARHRAGYERHPVQPGELDDWHDEQVWVD